MTGVQTCALPISEYHHLRSFGSACFVLLQPYEHNKLEPRSRLCCFLCYGKTQKGYQCYDPVSHRLRISRNVVFWDHRLFVKLSHFRTSLSSSSILDLFPDKAYIPSVAALDPPGIVTDSPVDFSIQPPDILDPFSSAPFNEQMEDKQVKDELPNLELGSLAPAPPEDLAQDIPPRHLTRERFIPTHLLNYHCYTARASHLS